MSKPLIVVGDTHSHGGSVLSSSSQTDIDGKLVVCHGDEAICQLHGKTVVVNASSNVFCFGKAVACDGDKLACGGVLKASQTSVDCF